MKGEYDEILKFAVRKSMCLSFGGTEKCVYQRVGFECNACTSRVSMFVFSRDRRILRGIEDVRSAESYGDRGFPRLEFEDSKRAL
jgi:hypothetical protein